MESKNKMFAYIKMPPPRKLQDTPTPSKRQKQILRQYFGIQRATDERYLQLRNTYNLRLPRIKQEYQDQQVVANLVGNIFANVRQTQAQEGRARNLLRRGVQRYLQARNIPIENWDNYVSQRRRDPNAPFSITLQSATMLGVRRTFNFRNIYHFRKFVEYILDQQLDGNSEMIIQYRDVLGENPDVFLTARITIDEVRGGCSKCGRKETMDLQFGAGKFTLYNPIVKHNNCGLACIEKLLNIKLNYFEERKKHNLKTEELISPEIIKKVYFEYSKSHKFLCIIDRNYSGNILLHRYDYIMYNKNHYRAVVDQVYNPDTNEDGKHIKVLRGLLAFDFETRVIDPQGKGVKTGSTYRKLMVDSICSIHYQKYKSKDFATTTFTTTDLDEGRSARQFIDFLKAEHENKRHYTCIAHNGSRFDFLILQSVMTPEEKLHAEFQYRGYSIIGMTFYNHIFRDPCCFLVGSLDRLCKSFKISNAKMTTDIYKGMDNKQLCFYKPELSIYEFLDLQNTEPEYWEKYVEYCEMDCVSLMELWSKFAKETNSLIKKMGSYTRKDGKYCDGDWLASKCALISKTTIGSLAKKLVSTLNPITKDSKMKFYVDFFADGYEGGEPIINEPKYEFVCKFKRGGISHCNQAGKHTESVSSVDITSQYPASMNHMIIPAGQSRWTKEWLPNSYGYYHIKNLKFQSTQKFRPICAYKEGVLDWTTEWREDTETYVDTEMIKYLISHNGLVSFDVIDGLVSKYYVKGNHIFGNYIDSLFGEKAKQDELKGTADYNPAMREVCKLFMNSMSGKLVEDPSKYFQLIYTPDPKNKKDNIDGIGFNREKTEKQYNYWVGAGVMVYSYSKRLLWEYVRMLPNESDDIIHIETDGIYFPSKYRTHLEKQIENYDGKYPVAMGDQLGNVKYEHQSVGDSYWLGKKFYYMNCKDEGDVLKIKGVPLKTIDEEGNEIKLITPESYADYYNGKPISATFSTIYKNVFGRIELSQMKMTRVLNPDTSKFKEYF